VAGSGRWDFIKQERGHGVARRTSASAHDVLDVLDVVRAVTPARPSIRADHVRAPHVDRGLVVPEKALAPHSSFATRSPSPPCVADIRHSLHHTTSTLASAILIALAPSDASHCGDLFATPPGPRVRPLRWFAPLQCVDPGGLRRLTQGLFKPIPGLVGALGGALHQTTSAAVGAVNDTTSIIGLPLPNLPLLGLLQNQNHSQAQPASAASVDGVGSDDAFSAESAGDVSSYGYDAPACQVTPYNMSVVPMADTIPAPYDEAKANIFRYRQQQSVNLGSWFVFPSFSSSRVLIIVQVRA
jgi:hypothetical protein